MDVFEAGHEQVVIREDRDVGLRAVIAIHDTRMGPALGGTRHWVYPSGASALDDALRQDGHGPVRWSECERSLPTLRNPSIRTIPQSLIC